ncbi:transposase [Streptomyces sp. NPDC056708]|uniref:transposase n=1 Tax=Streptomyces sp. NPDC056708 TaxID=3345920 RepID=UPI003694C4EB
MAAARVLAGRKRLNDRNALDGVARKFRAGAPWRDVPAIRPVGHTAHRCHRRAKDGTFERMLRPAQAEGDAAGLSVNNARDQYS